MFMLRWPSISKSGYILLIIINKMFKWYALHKILVRGSLRVQFISVRSIVADTLVSIIPCRWSRRCSTAAAMSISFTPLHSLVKVMSSRMYVPVRPIPSKGNIHYTLYNVQMYSYARQVVYIMQMYGCSRKVVNVVDTDCTLFALYTILFILYKV